MIPFLTYWTSNDINMQGTQKFKGEVPICVVPHFSKLAHPTPDKQPSNVIQQSQLGQQILIIKIYSND